MATLQLREEFMAAAGFILWMQDNDEIHAQDKLNILGMFRQGKDGDNTTSTFSAGRILIFVCDPGRDFSFWKRWLAVLFSALLYHQARWALLVSKSAQLKEYR